MQDTPTTHPPFSTPPQVNLVPANSSYCTTAGTPADKRLYYLNTASKRALPRSGFICINYRDNPIPDTIIGANQTAHAAIKAYNQAQNIPDSPWLYYKLLNVQYQVIDKDYAGVYAGTDPNSGHNPSSYHLANIVVETTGRCNCSAAASSPAEAPAPTATSTRSLAGRPAPPSIATCTTTTVRPTWADAWAVMEARASTRAETSASSLAVGPVTMPEAPLRRPPPAQQWSHAIAGSPETSQASSNEVLSQAEAKSTRGIREPSPQTRPLQDA